jgi:hypothetical protein
MHIKHISTSAANCLDACFNVISYGFFNDRSFRSFKTEKMSFNIAGAVYSANVTIRIPKAFLCDEFNKASQSLFNLRAEMNAELLNFIENEFGSLAKKEMCFGWTERKRNRSLSKYMTRKLRRCFDNRESVVMSKLKLSEYVDESGRDLKPTVVVKSLWV